MTGSRCALGLSVILVTTMQCSPSGRHATLSPLGEPTHVDCVAVLGVNRPYPEVPLASVPLSGVPQDKFIRDLTDDETGRFCDYLNCISQNGYGHGFVQSGPRFHPRSPAVLSSDVTAYASSDASDVRAYGDQTRAECVEFTRRTWGACHAGLWEEWVREAKWVPTEALQWVLKGPAYRATDKECGF